MPYKSKKPCAFPRCPKATHSKYCDVHKHLLNEEKKGNIKRHKLYNTAKWKRLRKIKLVQSPICEECVKYGRVEPGKEIDHIKPHGGDPALFYDYLNLQTLCKSCHSKKTGREQAVKLRY